MSCDYGIWFPDHDFQRKEASNRYVRLCEGDLRDVVEHPSVDAFYQELISLHPERDDVPENRLNDFDFCPWSIRMDRSHGHLIICCVWSKADYAHELLKRLATKHGLLLFDPQSERISYPGVSAAKSENRFWWRFWK